MACKSSAPYNEQFLVRGECAITKGKTGTCLGMTEKLVDWDINTKKQWCL